MLLVNGSLTHRLVHEDGFQSELRLYDPESYCTDDLIILHNLTHSEDNVVDFAYICVNNQVRDRLLAHVLDVRVCIVVCCITILIIIEFFVN
jgi:hypothetical protein